jgi:EAL domain-containing protein (putative c-di-GMP-specific phosphodiesterase class I)/FixJ family two-component response regulator
MDSRAEQIPDVSSGTYPLHPRPVSAGLVLGAEHHPAPKRPHDPRVKLWSPPRNGLGRTATMNNGGRVTVLVAEDDEIMRRVLMSVIGREPTLELVGSASNADEAIIAADAAKPDVAIVDVNMPGGGGERAAREIRRKSPSTKVLAFSAVRDRSAVVGMLEAGAVGYLVKGGPAQEILDSIATTASGDSILSSDIAGEVISELVEQRGVIRKREERLRLHHRRIERVIADEQLLDLVGQPICSLETSQVVGVEMLARFRGPPHRGPHRWFAEAEEVGLRSKLELLAAKRAFARLGELPLHSYLSVNASPAVAMSKSFRRIIESAPSERIVIEITENAPIANYSRLNAAMAPMRAAGVRLAIDDAGAGFASLRHILLLNPEIIKLDTTLIAGIENNRSAQALAAGLISFAARVGATIVAEGVETPEQLDALRVLGVPYGQGYYLGRPTSSLASLTTAPSTL